MLGEKFKSYFSLYINQGRVSCSECFQSPLEQPWTAANVLPPHPISTLFFLEETRGCLHACTLLLGEHAAFTWRAFRAPEKAGRNP